MESDEIDIEEIQEENIEEQKLKLNKGNALYIRQNAEERKFLTKDLPEIMQSKRDGRLK